MNEIFHLEVKTPGICSFFQKQFSVNYFDPEINYRFLHRFYQGEDQPQKRWEDIYQTDLKRSGFQDKTIQQLISAWGQLKSEGLFNVVEKNIATISSIERERPGAARVLLDDFGICDFFRYPTEILIKQYDEKDEDLPYGIAIYPLSDYNGAFSQDKQLFNTLTDDLQNRYALRIIEAQSKIDIARALLTLKKRYGANHKISFALIGGHGLKDRIRFGDVGTIGDLYIEDLKGKGVKRTSEFFGEQPAILLASCKTGQEGGIAQMLSESIGATVIGPEIATNMDNIFVTFDDSGKPHFEVEYADPGVERSYTKGIPTSSQTLPG